MKEKFYYYRCTDPTRLKFYHVYDHGRGLVGFKTKLKEPVRAAYGIEFWGLWNEKEMVEGYLLRKVKAVGRQSKRKQGSESGGGRY